MTVELTERGLAREEVVAVARGGDAVSVGAGAVDVNRTRETPGTS